MTNSSFTGSLINHQTCILTAKIIGLILAWKAHVWNLKVNTSNEQVANVRGMVWSVCLLNSTADTAEETALLTSYNAISFCKVKHLNSNYINVQLNSYISYNLWIRKQVRNAGQLLWLMFVMPTHVPLKGKFSSWFIINGNCMPNSLYTMQKMRSFTSIMTEK